MYQFIEQYSARSKVGSPGDVVEIDDTVVSRRKYNKGRFKPTKWLVGAISRRSGKFILKTVEKMDAGI